MSIKVEIGLVIVTALLGFATLHHTKPFEPTPAAERTSVFAADDFAAFDRNFAINGKPCDVGLERRKICLTPSPLQAWIIEGEAIPSNVPLLAAEFPILAALPMKLETQKLLRYGTVLVLIDAESSMVEDVLYIEANTFADASRKGQTELVDSGEPHIAG